MKLILASIATAIALFASIQIVSAARSDYALGFALAYQNCVVSNGWDKSTAPSVSVAPSGRRVFDYDATVQANIDSINKCTLPYFTQLTAACSCNEFADDAAIYTAELGRLQTWILVPIVNVELAPGFFETVTLGTPRAKFLMGN